MGFDVTSWDVYSCFLTLSLREPEQGRIGKDGATRSDALSRIFWPTVWSYLGPMRASLTTL